jgi:hypothetical protein
VRGLAVRTIAITVFDPGRELLTSGYISYRGFLRCDVGRDDWRHLVKLSGGCGPEDT